MTLGTASPIQRSWKILDNFFSFVSNWGQAPRIGQLDASTGGAACGATNGKNQWREFLAQLQTFSVPWVNSVRAPVSWLTLDCVFAVWPLSAPVFKPGSLALQGNLAQYLSTIFSPLKQGSQLLRMLTDKYFITVLVVWRQSRLAKSYCLRFSCLKQNILQPVLKNLGEGIN